MTAYLCEGCAHRVVSPRDTDYCANLHVIKHPPKNAEGKSVCLWPTSAKMLHGNGKLKAVYISPTLYQDIVSCPGYRGLLDEDVPVMVNVEEDVEEGMKDTSIAKSAPMGFFDELLLPKEVTKERRQQSMGTQVGAFRNYRHELQELCRLHTESLYPVLGRTYPFDMQVRGANLVRFSSALNSWTVQLTKDGGSYHVYVRLAGGAFTKADRERMVYPWLGWFSPRQDEWTSFVAPVMDEYDAKTFFDYVIKDNVQALVSICQREKHTGNPDANMVATLLRPRKWHVLSSIDGRSFYPYYPQES